MLNLQEITLSYINHQFQPELMEVVLESCIILQRFCVDKFEDDLINLLAASEDIDAFELRDQFVQRVKDAVSEVVTAHLIQIDNDSEATLKELNEIAQFMLIVQDLEDTSQMGYRVYGHGSPKDILMDLMAIYSTMSRPRAMEIVASVGENLIKALQVMTEDKAEAIDSNEKQRKDWLAFQTFTSQTPCLGTRLYTQGYFGLSFEELRDLSRFSIQSYVTESAKVRPSQAALDVLSLMLVCRDTYQTPLLSLEKNASDLFTDLADSTLARLSVQSLYVDFNTWLQASKPGLATQQGVVG